LDCNTTSDPCELQTPRVPVTLLDRLPRLHQADGRQADDDHCHQADVAVRFIAGRLRDTQQQLRQAMTERVERRVARAILRLVHDAGRRIDEGNEITFPISRQDLAEMTGTTLSTVSRLLSAWEEDGIVRSGRERIVVTKPHALAAIADDLPARNNTSS